MTGAAHTALVLSGGGARGAYQVGVLKAIAEWLPEDAPVRSRSWSARRPVRSEVVDGETGFLVPVRNSSALAAALAYLLRHPEAASRMGQAGRSRAKHLYDERRVLERQWQVFRRLVAGKTGRAIGP